LTKPEGSTLAAIHTQPSYDATTFYKTTVTALKRDNRNVAVIRPGMILTIHFAR